MRRAWPLVCAGAALGLALEVGCATSPVRPQGAATVSTSCHAAKFRGRYAPPGGGAARAFVLRAAWCAETLTLEVRGSVGGAVMQAAVRERRARLLLPREKVVVDGPDAESFWRRWTQVPVSGELVRSLAEARAGVVQVGAWSVTLKPAEPGEVWPAQVQADSARDGALTLEKLDERVLTAPPTWPEVPPGFDWRREEAAATPAASPGGD